MSAVVGRSHGGDAGGDPPPGSRRPASGCASNVSKKRRGKSKNKTLREIWEEGGKKPLAIKFDVEDQKTYRPVGALSKKFVNFVGIEVRKNVSLLYDKWENVPEEEKRLIWPRLHMYFDLVPHLRSDYGNELRKGIDSLAGTLYKDAKSKFKKAHYEDKGGLSNESEIRNQPLPNMSVVVANFKKCRR